MKFWPRTSHGGSPGPPGLSGGHDPISWLNNQVDIPATGPRSHAGVPAWGVTALVVAKPKGTPPRSGWQIERLILCLRPCAVAEVSTAPRGWRPVQAGGPLHPRLRRRSGESRQATGDGNLTRRRPECRGSCSVCRAPPRGRPSVPRAQSAPSRPRSQGVPEDG